MDLKKLTIKEILNSYDLPHKFLVRFTLFCANDVKHLLEDESSLKALEVIELWLEDKATDNDIANVYHAAYAANAAAASNATGTGGANAHDAAHYADYAATAATYAAANAHDAAHYADYAADYATTAGNAAYTTYAAYAYKSRLISMINELTPLEQELYRR